MNRTHGPMRGMFPFFVEEERNYEAFQAGLVGLSSDGGVSVTPPAHTTTAADVNDKTQNSFPIQWLIGN